MPMANSGSVRVAAVIYAAGFAIDDFLNEIASQLRAEQVRLGGAVQENLRGDEPCAAMVLTDLQSQRRFRISQELGSQAQACRLDAAGLAEIGALLDRTIDRDIELMILNRFGVAEAEGRGLRSIFARAIEAGVPVLTAVRPPYTEGWAEFHGGLALDLPPQLAPVLAWCRESVRRSRAARQVELSPAGPA
jgi:nucleoside-triphosphatase THEP1